MSFADTIKSIYGEDGERWLKALPERLNHLAKRYGLSALSAVDNLSYNYVAKAIRGEQAVVLKLGLNERAIENEVRCLQAFPQGSVAEVLEYEPSMILMRCLQPGRTLKTLYTEHEAEASKQFCELLARLQKNQSLLPAVKHLRELLKSLETPHDIPAPVVQKARALGKALLESCPNECLLHGDLHHENILLDGRDWKAIDPQGFIGDPVFDVCAYVLNPFPILIQHPKAKALIDARICDISKRLSMPLSRIRDWVYVKNVLCWQWSLDDNLSPDYNRALATLLECL